MMSEDEDLKKFLDYGIRVSGKFWRTGVKKMKILKICLQGDELMEIIGKKKGKLDNFWINLNGVSLYDSLMNLEQNSVRKREFG